MLLAYYRLYITYALYGFPFDLDQSNICRDIQKIKPLLIRNCLPIQQKIYNITKRLNTLEDFETHFPSFCLSYSVFHILSFIFCLSYSVFHILSFIDSTEQSIPRPIDNKRRKIYYSGKRKRHRLWLTTLASCFVA